MADHDTHDHTGVPGVGTSSTTVATDTIFDAAGDLVQGTGANTSAKLSAGTSGKVLTSNGAAAALTWETPSAGGSVATDTIFDAAGDLVVGTGSNTAAKLSIGSSGDVLTVSGGTPAWAAPSGGSSTHSYALDNQAALNGTYGDDFSAASLSGIWTRRNFAGGAETYQVGGNGSFMRIVTTGRAAGDGYFQTAPGGDWTFMMSFVTRRAGGTHNFGIACVNTVGTGVATGVANTGAESFCVLGVTTYTTYASSFQQVDGGGDSTLQVNANKNDRKWWHKLRKSGTNYYGAYSLDGETWSNETPAFSSGITVDRVGMFFEPQVAINTSAYYDIDLFNKIA